MAHYKDIAATAQQRRTASIPEEYLLPTAILQNASQNVTSIPKDSGHFTHDETEIIHSEAEDILQKIREGIWSSVEVAQAFCKAAAVAQQLTNCLTEILFAEAVETAKRLDNHLADTGRPKGPLHGLPISLKDCFITPPHPSSVGMSGYANIPTRPEEETVIVAMLKDLGAVPYVKTNIPTAMMMMETNNNVWGPCVNPIHRGTSSGGSSGGEGALLAMYGSPLGIGTDIGGSIRIPSAFQGLYGLKPSYGRFPQQGTRSGIPGQEFVLAVNGPMSRSLESLVLYSSAMLSDAPAASPWKKDPKILPIPWRKGPHVQPQGRRLRLGFVPPYDGLITAHPPVARALQATRVAVERAGHEVVDWAPDDHPEIVKLLIATFLDFGGKPIVDQMSQHQEPLFAAMTAYAEVAKAGEADLTPSKLRARTMQRNALQKKYLDRWQATADAPNGKYPIDGLIMAASPWSAVRAGFTNEGSGKPYFGYTGVFSLLDLPVCTFPVTRVNKNIDHRNPDFQPLNDLDAVIQADYDPEFYTGTPVALQLVGERLMEEKVLEVVGIVREALIAADVR